MEVRLGLHVCMRVYVKRDEQNFKIIINLSLKAIELTFTVCKEIIHRG